MKGKYDARTCLMSPATYEYAISHPRPFVSRVNKKISPPLIT